MVGYRDDPERTARSMRGGYYHTGDVASRDADGYITYVGRADDVFKASDYRISPFELESVLIEHPAVAEAAVVPSPTRAARRAQGLVVLAAGTSRAASWPGDLRLRARAPRAVQAGAPPRVRRSAQDHLRQDPPGRAAGVEAERHGPAEDQPPAPGAAATPGATATAGAWLPPDRGYRLSRAWHARAGHPRRPAALPSSGKRTSRT